MSARQEERNPGTDGRAHQDAHQTAEQKAHQVGAVTGEPDAADFPPLVGDRHAHGFFQKRFGDVQFEIGHPTGFRSLPAGQQLALLVEHLGVGHLFVGGNQRQRFGGGGFVVEHHRRFHGVADRARDQVQVVIGVHAQGQHAEQRQ
ncbi:hypothetical protein D3C78_991870 [compost metagenome]